MATILADKIYKIFLYEYDRIQIQISLKVVPKSPINNKPALVQVMAWHWPGNKPLHEPMMAQLPYAHMRHFERRVKEATSKIMEKYIKYITWIYEFLMI